MAASLPPAPSWTPVTPSGSNPDTNSKPSMTPSTGTSAPASPLNSGSAPEIEKDEVSASVGAPIEKPVLSKSKRRRDRSSKPKLKKKKKQTAQCMGYYIDALDKKMLWAEARIIQCNLITQKIKVHFVGWSKNYDLWTDPMSITAHGRYAPRTKKDNTVKSWDGDIHLFEDMLGAIEGATFTPVPVPAEKQHLVASTTSSIKKKASDKKKVPSEKAFSTKSSSAPQRERSHSKRKAIVESRSVKSDAKMAESNRHQQERVRDSKRAGEVTKGKEGTEEKEESLRNSKRQKRESQRPASTTAPTTARARSLKKKRAFSPDQLPLFRDLELDDGTELNFSVQREEARAEQQAMQSFLDTCAVVWKKQLAQSVQ